VRDITNASGSVIDSISYDAFGKVLSQTALSVTGYYGFQGMRMDQDLAANETPGRFLSWFTARWFQQDPLGFSAGDPDLYRGMGNDPTNATDPTGLQDIRTLDPVYKTEMGILAGPFAGNFFAILNRAKPGAVENQQYGLLVRLGETKGYDALKKQLEDAFSKIVVKSKDNLQELKPRAPAMSILEDFRSQADRVKNQYQLKNAFFVPEVWTLKDPGKTDHELDWTVGKNNKIGQLIPVGSANLTDDKKINSLQMQGYSIPTKEGGGKAFRLKAYKVIGLPVNDPRYPPDQIGTICNSISLNADKGDGGPYWIFAPDMEKYLDRYYQRVPLADCKKGDIIAFRVECFSNTAQLTVQDKDDPFVFTLGKEKVYTNLKHTMPVIDIKK
jgi:RHS repeat-associated protein